MRGKSFKFNNLGAASFFLGLLLLSKGDFMEQLEQIEKMIYLIRGQRVMLDTDLAKLYGVETKRLNEQVRRNLKRFPDDFKFQLTQVEFDSLKITLGAKIIGSGGKRKLPLVFTENGVAMLSSVLKSDQAILVNVSIMRIFTKLRSFLLMETNDNSRLTNLEQGTNQIFKVVFERLDNVEGEIEELKEIRPTLSPKRKRIGLK
jgi:hypothetical protein